jgi:hypothetical protein
MAKIRATDPKKVIKAAKNVAKKQSKKTKESKQTLLDVLDVNEMEIFTSLKWASYRLSLIKEIYWMNDNPDIAVKDFRDRVQLIMDSIDSAFLEYKRIYPNG